MDTDMAPVPTVNTYSWHDLPDDMQRAIICSGLRDGSVNTESERRNASKMRLVSPLWADMVCECVRILRWHPKLGRGSAATEQSIAFILRLKRLEELRLNTSKASDATVPILQQLDKLASLRSLHLEHVHTTGGGQTADIATLDHLAWIQESSLTDFSINWGPHVSTQKLQKLLQSLPISMLSLDVACGSPAERTEESVPYSLKTTQLTSLKLKGLQIDKSGLGGLIEGLQSLVHLNLSEL